VNNSAVIISIVIFLKKEIKHESELIAECIGIRLQVFIDEQSKKRCG